MKKIDLQTEMTILQHKARLTRGAHTLPWRKTPQPSRRKCQIAATDNPSPVVVASQNNMYNLLTFSADASPIISGDFLEGYFLDCESGLSQSCSIEIDFSSLCGSF